MAMSFYPREGEPLWSRYSTHAVAHTLEVYSRYTFPYPYPVAISVNGPVGGGMEYPMISFNKPRPEADGTYSRQQKYRMISIIIHEVGHNWFPMIVNSDERQWMWMDEGMNTFVQYLAEREWEEDYPSWAGEPSQIVNYMTSYPQTPIMTSADSAIAIGPNAYHKPAAAYNILRETIMGREQFDFAFKEFSNRWKFKRPTPADFFRSMNDAAGVDLDWFWRGWFFTTDHVDVAIENVTRYEMDTGNPDIDKDRQRADRDAEPRTISQQRNEGIDLRVDRYPDLLDFYNEYDELDVTEKDRESYRQLLEKLDADEIERLESDTRFYVIDFKNIGGLLTPLILKIEYEDGDTEIVHIPAEIWRLNYREVSKLLLVNKPVQRITLDPFLQTPDADRSNNVYPQRIETRRFSVSKPEPGTNPMREAVSDNSENEEDATHE